MPVNAQALLEALNEIRECAETTGLDAELRLAWISMRVDEAINAATGEYTNAETFKIKREAVGALLTMYFNASRKQPIVLGVPADDAEAEASMGKAVWYRSAESTGE